MLPTTSLSLPLSPNFYASSSTFIYFSSLFSKPINQTHHQEQDQEQEQYQEQEKDSNSQEGNTESERFVDLEKQMAYEKVNELNLKDTELRLGLPGTEQIIQEQEVSCVRSNKRPFESNDEEIRDVEESTPPTK